MDILDNKSSRILKIGHTISQVTLSLGMASSIGPDVYDTVVMVEHNCMARCKWNMM